MAGAAATGTAPQAATLRGLMTTAVVPSAVITSIKSATTGHRSQWKAAEQMEWAARNVEQVLLAGRDGQRALVSHLTVGGGGGTRHCRHMARRPYVSGSTTAAPTR
jgi:hypothetical protein